MMPEPISGVSPPVPIEVAQTGQAGTVPGAARPHEASSGPSAPASVDSADVARAEALLTTISTAAAEVSAIDEARVAALRQAVQSGAYQVDPQQIAQRMLDIENLLSAGTGGK